MFFRVRVWEFEGSMEEGEIDEEKEKVNGNRGGNVEGKCGF